MNFFSRNFAKKDAFALSVALGLVLAVYGMSRLVGWITPELVFIILGFLVLVLLTVNRRRFLNELSALRSSIARLDQHTKQFFSQTEYLVSINAGLIRGQFPLPKTGGWVPAPDYLHFIMSHLHQRRPALVLEAGSGVSTYLIAKTLDDIGEGQIIALEHLDTFADKTKQLIEAAGLQHRAQILHAPLRKYELDGNAYRWYDLTKLQLPEPIGLFVIDGPPGNTCKHARYPALPLLHKRMADNAVLLLDDAARPEEREIADMWSNDFDVDVEHLDFKKGAFYIELISRHEKGQSRSKRVSEK